jgi:UDP-2,3-diacylglucosamine pyrophosphatase LpxH
MGDLYDFYSWSRFPKSVNLFSPTEELKAAISSAKKFWQKIREAAPKAKCYQLIGNHDERIYKRVIEKSPEFEDFINLEKLWDFEGVKVMPSEREELVLNDIIFIHGYRGKIGDHAKFNLKHTVCGHLHRGGVVFVRHGERIIFELNAGTVADLNSKPMSYSKQKQFGNMTNGFGFIDEYGPSFIPLVKGKTWQKK